MQAHAVPFISKISNAITRRRWRSQSFVIALRSIVLTVLIATTAVIGIGQTATPNGDGWVVLPVTEYAALRHAAFPAEAESPPLAVEATLSRLDYDLKVDGDLASGEARLTIDVIRDGWVRVPLPEGLMVRKARLDGREVSLITHATEKGPGSAELLLSKTGRSVLTLKIVADDDGRAGDVLKARVLHPEFLSAILAD